MNNDDEEAESGPNIGVSKYPCLPSLVALQQMRYRLQLAHLGRRLMKWTATATRKELMKISEEMSKSHHNYATKVADAYMSLARARFYYPNLNQIVLQNVAKTAAVRVVTTFNTMTGIKCINFKLVHTKMKDFDIELDPYHHLGISRGGDCIKETKRLWYELLRRQVMMLQLRDSFVLMEISHKSAYKRMNVLGKLVMPKLEATIKYILFILEEREREDFYRIKKVKEYKLKAAMQRNKVEVISLDTENKTILVHEDKVEVISNDTENKTIPNNPSDVCVSCSEPLSKESYKDALSDINTQLDEVNLNVESQIEKAKKLTIDENVYLTELNEDLNVETQIKKVKELTIDENEKCIVQRSMETVLDESQSKQSSEKYLPREEVQESLGTSLDEIEPKQISENYLPREEDLLKLCEKCRKRWMKLHEKESNVPTTSLSLNIEQRSSSEIRKKPAYQERTIPDNGEELGIFETEIEIVTKILRKKNPDGSVMEDKKVIQIKKVSKKPSNVNNKTEDTVMFCIAPGISFRKSYQDFTDKRELVTSNEQKSVKKTCTLPEKAKSEIYLGTASIKDNFFRSCISSASVYSLSSGIENKSKMLATVVQHHSSQIIPQDIAKTSK